MKEVLLEELSSPGCSYCKAFEEFWRSIEKDWPNVTYKNVSVTTPEGIAMVQKYMIFASPGVVINGELFSTGGVDKEKFLTKLGKLSAE